MLAEGGVQNPSLTHQANNLLDLPFGGMTVRPDERVHRTTCGPRASACPPVSPAWLQRSMEGADSSAGDGKQPVSTLEEVFPVCCRSVRDSPKLSFYPSSIHAETNL